MLDPLFMDAGKPKLYRYLRFSWQAGPSWGNNFGFGGIRIFADGVQYPLAMTGPSSPAPWAATADAGANVWYCFDRNEGTFGTEYIRSGNGAGWIQLDCGAGFGISPDRVEFLVRQSLEGPPSPLLLLGSMDAGTWDTLATFTYGPWTYDWRVFNTGLAPGYGAT